MSKTFKNATNSGTEVYVGEGINTDSVQLIIRNVGSGIGKAGIYLNSSDIPALALAILEAAGVEAKPSNDDPGTPGNLGRIAYQLMIHIEDAENITAEAEAQAKLEAEALELFNVNQGINLPDWGNADRAVISSWVRVARRARELAKEATK